MTVRVIEGDCRAVLATLPDESAHCVVTSPPYWGLRDYGIAAGIWGGDPACKHGWTAERVATEIGKGNWSQGINGRGEMQPGGVAAKRKPIRSEAERAWCVSCGAWRGTFGLEPTLDLYVAHAVEVFRAVRRVLRPDGTLWLNLGDSYATGGGKVGEHLGGGAQGARWKGQRGVHRVETSGKHAYRIQAMGPVTQPNRMPQPGLKPKDLCMVPARVALALQADGWWLRSEIVWAKPNPMPESVTDRPTSAHEKVYLLTKSARYWYDAEAVKEPVIKGASGSRFDFGKTGARDGGDRTQPGYRDSTSRNLRNVWNIATAPFPDAHFATFPPALVETCIMAGCPEGGTVLDPFGGSGTVGLVADRLGRDAILIELNPAYCEMARKRITADAPLFTDRISA